MMSDTEVTFLKDPAGSAVQFVGPFTKWESRIPVQKIHEKFQGSNGGALNQVWGPSENWSPFLPLSSSGARKVSPRPKAVH